MTKLHLKYVQTFRAAGATYHYFRRRGMARIPLPGIPGSAEFMATYQQALAAAPLPVGASMRSKPGSVSAAIAEYFSSQKFRALAARTQVKRREMLERHFREDHGHVTLVSMPREFIVALLDTLSPAAARNTLNAIRHFTGWAVERKLMRADPTLSIHIRLPHSDGHHTWTEDEIAAYEAKHPIGSKARLALALGLYTAQRRSDAIRIGRQHIRDGVLTVRQQKTGATLAIPVHRELAAIIEATPAGHFTLLMNRAGKSYKGDDFTDQFRKWCKAAGLPQHCVFHGLRKAALTRLADLGCSVHEIAAISGHKSLREVERYTKAADQAKLARAAMERFGTESVKPEPTEVSKSLNSFPKKAG
jgi:integrase